MGGKRGGSEHGKPRVAGPAAAERFAVAAPVRQVVHGLAQVLQLPAQTAQENHRTDDAQRDYAQNHDRADQEEPRGLGGHVVVEEFAGIAEGERPDIPSEVVSQGHSDDTGVALQVGPDLPPAAGAPCRDPFLGDEVPHEAGIGAEQHDAFLVEHLDGQDLLAGLLVLSQHFGNALQIGKLDTEIHLRFHALTHVVDLELEPRGQEIGERALEYVRAQHGGHRHAGGENDHQGHGDLCGQPEFHAGAPLALPRNGASQEACGLGK